MRYYSSTAISRCRIICIINSWAGSWICGTLLCISWIHNTLSITSHYIRMEECWNIWILSTYIETITSIYHAVWIYLSVSPVRWVDWVSIFWYTYSCSIRYWQPLLLHPCFRINLQISISLRANWWICNAWRRHMIMIDSSRLRVC